MKGVVKKLDALGSARANNSADGSRAASVDILAALTTMTGIAAMTAISFVYLVV